MKGILIKKGRDGSGDRRKRGKSPSLLHERQKGKRNLCKREMVSGRS